MSTHSAIGHNDGASGGWEAVCCQWNGKPSEQVPAIFRLVNGVHRGDVGGALSYLLETCRKGFSVFNGAGVTRLRTPGAAMDGEDVDYVYPPDGPDLIVRSPGSLSPASRLRPGSWLYLLEARGVRVFRWTAAAQNANPTSAPHEAGFCGWEAGCPSQATLERLDQTASE
jgi:hypothetical protein